MGLSIKEHRGLVANALRALLLIGVTGFFLLFAFAVGIGSALSGDGGSWLLSLGLVLSIVSFIAGLFMWVRAPWARSIAIVFAIILVIASIFLLVRSILLSFAIGMMVGGVFLAVGALGVYLLSVDDDIKGAFKVDHG